jgi:hypothetical protein
MWRQRLQTSRRRKFMGIQMGPRQFELPPKRPVVLSPGVYSTL